MVLVRVLRAEWLHRRTFGAETGVCEIGGLWRCLANLELYFLKVLFLVPLFPCARAHLHPLSMMSLCLVCGTMDARNLLQGERRYHQRCTQDLSDR